MIFANAAGAAMANNPELPAWFPQETLTKGWEAHSNGADASQVRVVCKSRKITLSITVDKTELGAVPPATRQVLVEGQEGFTTGPLSVPVGMEDRCDRSAGRWRDVHVFTRGYLVRSLLNVSDQRPDGKVDPSTEDHSADEMLQEALTRGTAARLAGLSAAAPRYVDYRGRQIKSTTVSGSELYAYQIGAGTEALGISATMDYSNYVLTLNKGDRIVVVPLGTKRIVVNGTARDLATVSLEMDSAQYVQGEALDALF